ncbi:MAG: NUDIX hydrolase [Candidatus Berkelbacteria bacterium]
MAEISLQKVTQKGIFRRGDKYLFVKEDNQFWELPGGRLELGEELEAGFAREIEEELGWQNVKMGQVVSVWSKKGLASTHIQYIVVCVLAEAKDESIALSDEHIDFGWFTLAELETMQVLPGFIESIKKAEKVKEKNV